MGRFPDQVGGGELCIMHYFRLCLWFSFSPVSCSTIFMFRNFLFSSLPPSSFLYFRVALSLKKRRRGVGERWGTPTNFSPSRALSNGRHSLLFSDIEVDRLHRGRSSQLLYLKNKKLWCPFIKVSSWHATPVATTSYTGLATLRLAALKGEAD